MDEDYIAKLDQECAAVNKAAEDLLLQVKLKEIAVSNMARNYEADPVTPPEPKVSVAA